MPENATVLSAVLAELRAVKPEAGAWQADTPLLPTLDSLDVLEFVARVEQRFRVPVPDNRWKELRTPAAVAACVSEALAERDRG